MNVFVLCTGRSGSKTFYEACKHITNYTAGHESKNSEVGKERLTYPDHHIEIDNRLCWLLGRLDQRYGNEAFYVHLIRDEIQTAESFNKRWIGKYSIIRAYSEAILNRRDKTLKECLDYCRTVNSNIKLFLKDKENVMTIPLDEAEIRFREFWEAIGAEGELEKAVGEFQTHYNPSESRSSRLFRYIVYIVWRVKNVFR